MPSGTSHSARVDMAKVEKVARLDAPGGSRKPAFSPMSSNESAESLARTIANGGDEVDDLGGLLDELSTTSNAARVEIRVPNKKVGRVIGKHGSTIQMLKKQAKHAHCSISFDSSKRQVEILVIKGPNQGAVDSLAIEVNKVIDSDENFGIIPWTKVDSKFYFLAQVSYSAKHYDIKIDPFRGTKKTGDASNWHAAVRETLEESAHLLRFSAEELPVDAKPNKPVAVLVEFESWQDRSKFCASYDKNRWMVVDESVLGKDQVENTRECLGITWVDPTRIKQEETSKTLGIALVGPETNSAGGGKPLRYMQDEPKYRVAGQLMTGPLLAMKKRLEEGDTDIPRYALRRCSVDDKGLAAYTALPGPSSISTVDPSLPDPGQGWTHSTPFSASEKWLWERRRQHLREYPQDAGEMRARGGPTNKFQVTSEELDLGKKKLAEMAKEKARKKNRSSRGR